MVAWAHFDQHISDVLIKMRPSHHASLSQHIIIQHPSGRIRLVYRMRSSNISFLSSSHAWGGG